MGMANLDDKPGVVCSVHPTCILVCTVAAVRSISGIDLADCCNITHLLVQYVRIDSGVWIWAFQPDVDYPPWAKGATGSSSVLL